jgi:phage terminase small subunit
MEAEGSRVASTDECLEYLTRVIRGEEKDAFDLDISASDKMKAVSMLLDRLEGMNQNAGQVTIINNIPRPDTIIDVNPT